jgi:hypothetical protein
MSRLPTITPSATFARRALPVIPAAVDVPAHIKAEWTGEARPDANAAVARIRAVLA